MTTLLKVNNAYPVFNTLIDDLFKGYYAQNAKIATNVKELENAYQLELVVPGFEKEDFKVSIEDQYLKVQAKVETQSTSEDGKYTVKEYQKSSFEQSYKLPKGVDTEQVHAKYEKGILTITIDKKKVGEINAVKTVSIV